MKNTTPKMPIRLPTNSKMPADAGSSIGQKMAMSAPTTIIGMPTPTVIALDATSRITCEIYMSFMTDVVCCLTVWMAGHSTTKITRVYRMPR